MRKLRVARPAAKDLETISNHFLEQSIDVGDCFVKTFSKRCQHIARFPLIGQSNDPLRPNLRGLSFMGYIIFYQVNDESIEILRVVSGYRKSTNIFAD